MFSYLHFSRDSSAFNVDVFANQIRPLKACQQFCSRRPMVAEGKEPERPHLSASFISNESFLKKQHNGHRNVGEKQHWQHPISLA